MHFFKTDCCVTIKYWDGCIQITTQTMHNLHSPMKSEDYRCLQTQLSTLMTAFNVKIDATLESS